MAMLTVYQAAERLGIKARTPIYNLIYKRRIVASKDPFGTWWIDENEIERYKQGRRPWSRSEMEVQVWKAISRMDDRLERIEALLISQKLEQPRPEFKPPKPNGLNPVEEKEL